MLGYIMLCYVMLCYVFLCYVCNYFCCRIRPEVLLCDAQRDLLTIAKFLSISFFIYCKTDVLCHIFFLHS